MPIDQAHKQINEIIKSTGVAVGLTENSSTFRKWIVSGPEQATILKELKKRTYLVIQNLMLIMKKDFLHKKSFMSKQII